MCICLSVCVQRIGQSDQFKMVKAMDFKSDTHVPRDSPDMTSYKFFLKAGVADETGISQVF